MKKYISILYNIHEKVIIVLYILLVSIVFVEIIARYLLHLSLIWSTDFVTFIFIWLVFLSASLAVKEHSHFVIELSADLLPETVLKILDVIVSIVMYIVVFIFIFIGYKFMLLCGSGISPALGIRLVWLYQIVPLSSILMLIYMIGDLLESLKLNIKRRVDI
ncbi:MAG: TRAP transporter small permease [Caldisericia bacterium]|nr:TRAP transporter small permease [Caldisericia bacterium]